MDFGTRVLQLLLSHPSVRRVELTGSRAGGSTTPLSDWDFAVETDDFHALAVALPELVAPLEPLAKQWDPLAEHATYMLMLSGPMKVDLIFVGEAFEKRPPWEVRPDTLAAIDEHFWDWILWLAAKRTRDRDSLVREELEKMHGFLLAPLGAEGLPTTIDEAVAAYLSASAEAERRLARDVPRALRHEVLPALSEEQRVGSAGASVHVRCWGGPEAPPVLCWHGVNLTSPGSLRFAEAGPLLASRGLRVLALDAPGFGGSPPREPRGYHPHALADLVPPLLDALELDRVGFVGYSWGGDVGCHVAARHPDRIRALVLLDAGYSDPPFDPELPYQVYVERETELARELEGVTVSPQVVAAIEHGIAQALPSTTRAPLAASELPVLLVAAAATSEEDLAPFTREVPQAEVLRPEGVGHNVFGDGGPPVVLAVADWLRERAG